MKIYDETKLARMKEYINGLQFESGLSPSYRQVMGHMGWNDLAMVHRYVKVLEGRGDIQRTTAGAIETPHNLTTGRVVSAPLVGAVSCGNPQLALEEIHCSYALPVDLFGAADKFLLKAEGNSMINAGIHPGDLLIVERRTEAHNGQIVVALKVDEFGENEATTKRYFKENNRIRLQPENSDMDAMYFDRNQVQVCGIVIGVMRSYK